MPAKKPRKATRQDRKADAPPIDREEGGLFAPGKSPNPGGQPAWVKEVREALKECAPLAAEHLRKMLAGEVEGVEPKDLNKAAEIVLSYTVPKPKQEIKVEGAGGGSPLGTLSLEDLIAFGRGVKAAAAQPQAQKDGAP